jgi:ribA/ribD-fused uncharacterized protein
LSNFYPIKIEYEGIEYPSVEHAYVAAKTLDVDIRAQVASISGAAEAKKIGHRLTLRPGWDEIRLGIMEGLLRKKFSYEYPARLLLETGDEELVERNDWQDVFYGQCNGVGENHLGKLLMKLRDELRGKL